MTERVTMDRENLLTVEGVGCWHCEELWSPAVAAQRCDAYNSQA